MRFPTSSRNYKAHRKTADFFSVILSSVNEKTQKIFEAHRTMVLVSNVESKYSSLSKHGKSLKYASCSMCCYVFHFSFHLFIHIVETHTEKIAMEQLRQ